MFTRNGWIEKSAYLIGRPMRICHYFLMAVMVRIAFWDVQTVTFWNTRIVIKTVTIFLAFQPCWFQQKLRKMQKSRIVKFFTSRLVINNDTYTMLGFLLRGWIKHHSFKSPTWPKTEISSFFKKRHFSEATMFIILCCFKTVYRTVPTNST